MSQPPRTKIVTLDDADLEKRNEALIIENEILREKKADAEDSLFTLSRRIGVLWGVQIIGVLTPDQVHTLYAEIETAIEAFVGPMDKLIRENEEHKKRVEDAMLKKEGSAKAFRAAITANEELQAAAKHLDTCVIDIWTAYIWRFLLQKVFAEDAILELYSGDDQNASYYIKNLNEMEYLMTQADPPVFGLYSRRLWRRQALSAIFRTAEFEWVQSTRADNMEKLSQSLKRAFQVFAKPLGEDKIMELTRGIIDAAVQLSEHIMIEADDIWTIELEGVTGSEDDFYENLEDFDLKPVGNTENLMNNAPLDTLKRRFNLDEIKERLRKLCVVTPALRYQHIEEDGEGYKEVVHKVKPQVLIAFKGRPRPENEQAEYVPPDEKVFFNMAKSLGLIQEPVENK